MLSRLLTVCGLAATVLTPTANAVAEDDILNVRLTAVNFTGRIWIDRGAPGRPARLQARSSTCTVAGVVVTTQQPFLTYCEFFFNTGSAPVSTGCSGVWTHPSTLSFVEPTSGKSVEIGYDPTVTTSDLGQGAGVGVNQAHLGHVHYFFESLCEVTEDPTGNLVGHTSAL